MSTQNNNLGHRQRLRDKFLKSGLDGFHDYEIVELLLTIGTPRKDCKSIAKESLKIFKTLSGVLGANPKDLKEINGSILDSLYILFNFIFFLIASATNNSLFGIFIFNFFSISFLFNSKILSNPEKPTSKDTRAF